MTHTLYVDRQDSDLRWRDGALELRVPDEPLRVVPAKLLARVVLRADTRLSSATLAALADAGIGLVAFGGRGGQRVAHLLGSPAADCRVRLAQCLRTADERWAAEAARAVVRQRLRGQRRLLAQALASRPDLRKPLTDACETLDGALRSCAAAASVAALRGLEGAGAAAFFRAFTQLFAAALGFEARRRRPPPDPVNACLSLGYTLLHSQAVQAAWAAGLDPMVGFLHLPAPGRASLACDLMEPWRCEVEAWAWERFRSRELRAEHFGQDGAGACVMGKAARALFYASFHAVQRRTAIGLRRHARALAHALAADAVSPEESDGEPA